MLVAQYERERHRTASGEVVANPIVADALEGLARDVHWHGLALRAGLRNGAPTPEERAAVIRWFRCGQ